MELMPVLMERWVAARTPEPPLPGRTVERLDMGIVSNGNTIGCSGPSSGSTGGTQRLGHHGLVPLRELVEQRQDDRLVLSTFALPEVHAWAGAALTFGLCPATPWFVLVGRLAVGAHDAPSRGHAFVQDLLHHPALVAPLR